MFTIRINGLIPNSRSRSPLSYDMGHDIVQNMENLCPKRKLQTCVFSAVTASASRGEMHGWYCGWLVFLLFLNTNALSKKASKLKIRGQSASIHEFYDRSANLLPVENAHIFKET